MFERAPAPSVVFDPTDAGEENDGFGDIVEDRIGLDDVKDCELLLLLLLLLPEDGWLDTAALPDLRLYSTNASLDPHCSSLLSQVVAFSLKQLEECC